ncbi:hypothetical protein JVU11DRAFT_6669 [Chiua virens]|nr:hypothetical protein JVU11DRAFT_6669 [Chiua virens]
MTAIIQLVTAILFVAKALNIVNGQVQAVKLLELTEDPFMTLGTICLAVGAGADILIVIFMTFLLIRQRIATRFVSTAEILQRLTVFSVNTGTWPAAFSLATVILLHVFPSNLLYTVPYLPLCSLYCNTLLANLNVREYIKGATATHNAGRAVFARSNSQTSESTKTGTPSGR